MPSPGRNDPCPCGNGKKFKHCCLARPPAATGITPQDRSDALAALVRYSRRDEFADAVAIATLRWADQDDDDVREALASILEFETSTNAFFEWLSFDFRQDDGRTLAARFLDSRAWAISPPAVEHIRLMQDTHLRGYQVRDVTRDAGLSVRDLWSKDEFFVTERKGSTQLVRWDILVARVNVQSDGSRQFEGTMMPMPPAAAKFLRKALTAEHKWFSGRCPSEPLDAFFKHAGPIFHDFWYDYATVPPPDLHTTDGDPVTLSELVFDVPLAGVALAHLLGQPDFEPGKGGTAVWLETGLDPCLLAEVRCDAGTLTVSAFSRERAERARARLEQELGPLVLRHERHESPDLDSPVAPTGSASPEGTIALDQVPELAERMAQRDREWLDLEIPALDGSTPREAATDRRLRSRLRELLMEIENQEARMAGSGQGRDLTWRWKELGLRRP